MGMEFLLTLRFSHFGTLFLHVLIHLVVIYVRIKAHLPFPETIPVPLRDLLISLDVNLRRLKRVAHTNRKGDEVLTR